MQELSNEQLNEINGGVAPAVIFFAKFAAGYVGTFAAAAGFAYGAHEAMSLEK